MSVYEFVKDNRELLDVMEANRVEPYLCRRLAAYEEYLEMVARGEKKEYVYAYVSERHGMSKSTLVRLIRTMNAKMS